jgi:rRNA-processing protein FCF1
VTSAVALVLVRTAVVIVSALLGFRLAAAASLPGAAGVVGGGILGGLAVCLEQRLGRLPLAPVLLIVAAGGVGAAAGHLLGAAAAAVVPEAGAAARGLGVVLGAYLGAATLLGQGEIIERFVGWLVPGRARQLVSAKVLDTSVIIDGRLAEVCEAGFVEGTLIVPQFVLRELQQIADSSDGLKRNRGKRGFEMLQRLQRTPKATVLIDDRDFPHAREVDRKLIELARAVGARVVTNDYNLHRVAELSGLAVLNINELANAVKPVALPGEVMHVRVLKEGKEAGQGVAYLDDGTMVVVDQGRKYVGRAIDVTVTSVLQTAAGRMVFSRLRDEE